MKKKKIDYVENRYSEKDMPFTDYPNKLAKYLFKKNNMSQDEKILELGCGRGEFINAFINQGLDGYGLDSSESSKKLTLSLSINLSEVVDWGSWGEQELMINTNRIGNNFFIPKS